MAKPTTSTFGQFIIQISNGATPAVFAAPCGLTTKGFNQTANTQDTAVPDCSDPDAPAYVERGVDTLSAEITGSGVMAVEAFPVWQEWFDSAAPVAARVYPHGLTGGYYEGNFILTGFNLTAERGQKVNVDVTMSSDGQYTWVPVS